MSRLQFIALLSPSIGSFVLIIVAWMHSNLRLNDLKDSMNARFGDVSRQFGDVNRRFVDVNRQFDEMRADMNRQFDEVNRRLGLIEADQKQFYT